MQDYLNYVLSTTVLNFVFNFKQTIFFVRRNLLKDFASTLQFARLFGKRSELFRKYRSSKVVIFAQKRVAFNVHERTMTVAETL